MYGLEEQTDKKAMRYIDPRTRITRREFIALAEAINRTRIIRRNGDDWILQLGDLDDHTNLEALAIWISKQRDILVGCSKRERVRLRRERYQDKMDRYYQRFLELGFAGS